MVARLWLLLLELAFIIDAELDSSTPTKSSVTVTLSPSLAVLARKDDDDADAVGLLANVHVLRILLWLLMPTVLGAGDRDANASTRLM